MYFFALVLKYRLQFGTGVVAGGGGRVGGIGSPGGRWQRGDRGAVDEGAVRDDFVFTRVLWYSLFYKYGTYTRYYTSHYLHYRGRCIAKLPVNYPRVHQRYVHVQSVYMYVCMQMMMSSIFYY